MTPSPREMPPPPGREMAGSKPRDEPKPKEPEENEGPKMSAEEAIVLRSNDKVCGTCENYDAQNGMCNVVEGKFEPEDRCLRYWEALDDGDEDEDNPAMQLGEAKGGSSALALE